MMICALYLCSASTIITLGLEGSSALQFMVTNHDIYATIYIYLPSLAGIQTWDPDNKSRCQKIDALDRSAMIPLLMKTKKCSNYGDWRAEQLFLQVLTDDVGLWHNFILLLLLIFFCS